ncbi:putative fatty-acid--CoA ligase [Gordonia rhizosphera NBRC 16068]|uniref:Putative fatty-acid--CoA ligase n=1 Tax=Gordonia rhizosphera NBRC 16068 TaxID=1108045 RepID=K6V175_9ACTN|nr:putative fatty-acid--CoA ligase [Gordonia rhizosphera NBRC 16068]
MLLMAVAPMTLAHHALKTPTKTAIVMGAAGETATFEELEVRSRTLARALRDVIISGGVNIYPQETENALAAELMAHARARIAGYKCPRAVDFVDELPRETSGTLFKRRLRE